MNFDYRMIFESTPTAIFVVDSDKKVVDANTLALDIMKYTRRELIGKVCHQFICPRQEGKCPVFDLGEDVHNLETEVIRKDKVRLPVLKSCNKVDIEGQAFAIEGFVDISESKRMVEERKRLIEHLYHAQKMESIGALASGVAHEFRNVLTPIVGYVEFLEEMMEGGEGMEYLEVIRESALRGIGVAEKILDHSRKTPLNPEWIDLRRLLENTVTILRSTAPKNVKVGLSYKAWAREVYADKGLLEQAFMNLALNACDAMPEGGTLRFETRDAGQGDFPRGFDSCSSPDDWLLISVSDSGTGMDEKVRKRAFDPFFSTKGARGTGLGLFLVSNIVESHGGAITLESQEGHGTTFKILLPLKHDWAG
jgi:two-component system cell cycle sensor histidine kinase/response regulator CckA